MISTFTAINTFNSKPTATIKNKFLIEGTRTTPFVMYNGTSGFLEIKGKSSPKNSIEFYSEIIKELEVLSIDVIPNFRLNVALEYFNTSSAKCLFDIFKKLTVLEKLTTQVEVNWHYEDGDDDMLESGEDYAEISGLKFNFIAMD
jgi:hypothetical protein